MKRNIHFVFVGLLSLGAITFLGGCSTILLFDPKGPIGESERYVIIAAMVLMAIVVIPVFVMATVLAILAGTRTHSLDPYKPIQSAEKPIIIEAVSLDWKWLFIYPEQN